MSMNQNVQIIFHSSFFNSTVIVLILLIMFPLNVMSQNIWESFGTSSSPWSVSTDLESYSNTTSKVDFMNKNYQSEEDKRNNKWSAKTIWISTSSNQNSPLDISFSVENIIPSNLRNIYHKDNHWYWYVEIEYTTSAGQNKYFKLNYVTSKYSDSNNTYQEACTTDNGTQSKWETTTSLKVRRFRILFDDGEIKIYDSYGDHLAKTIYNVKNVRFVEVGASTGTHLEVTNTSCQRMTTYGQSLPYLQKAANYMDNNNASSAASEMTTAINKGLKCYDTYLMRGIAYYIQGYYKSAIEDLSSAINYSASNKEMAYYYRGMSKLALNDDYGINDLKNGGQDGLVFLRENNLMNYTPGQNKKKTTTNTAKKKTTSSQSKKPALKK